MHYLDNPLSVIELIAVWRIAIATLLGALLGLERSIAGKHAGMRTFALVSLGSALFVTAGILMEPWSFGALDPSRIAASVVMGIGFIGSGLAYLHAKNSDHTGEITTAAGIWVAAGIGVASGFGFYVLALGASLITTVVFTVFLRLENRARLSYGAPLPDGKKE